MKIVGNAKPKTTFFSKIGHFFLMESNRPLSTWGFELRTQASLWLVSKTLQLSFVCMKTLPSRIYLTFYNAAEATWHRRQNQFEYEMNIV